MAPHDGVTVKKDKLLETLRRLGAQPKHIVIGVVGQKAQEPHEGDKDTTVAEVAAWNHFGTSTIPARPFLTLAFEQHGDAIRALQARLAKGLVEGKIELDRAFELLGLEATARVKQTIIAHVPPPNAASTIERKGSSTPLIDKGQLLSSITHEVREGR